MLKKTFLVLTLFVTISLPIFSQSSNETISVFLDCRGCSENFIRTEIQFVNFVRDQSLADLHLLIIRQRSAGGAQFVIDFIEQKLPGKPTKEIVYESFDFQTEEEVRNGLVNTIELGLVSYLLDTDLINQLSLQYDTDVNTKENGNFEGEDTWNNWVFELGVDGSVNGQENDNRYNIGGDAEIRRITNDWKLRFNFWGNYNRRAVVDEQEVINGTDTTTVEVTEYFDRSSRNYFGLVAKTINDHWSVGFYSRYRSDTFVNINTQIGITPSIEYSLFPYNEFTRREVTARFGVVSSYFNYNEVTVFLQDEEFLFRPEIDLRADFTQPWGGFRAGVEAGAYLHDLDLNRFEFDARINLRISKYLSMFVNGEYSIIGDQISLPAGDLSAEELLAGVRQQPTSYSYRGSIGFEVQFGSIYNNIVNPRF